MHPLVCSGHWTVHHAFSYRYWYSYRTHMWSVVAFQDYGRRARIIETGKPEKRTQIDMTPAVQLPFIRDMELHYESLFSSYSETFTQPDHEHEHQSRDEQSNLISGVSNQIPFKPLCCIDL